MIGRAVVGVVAATIVASCGCVLQPMTTLDHSVQFDSSSSDAIVVFGFSPPRWSAWIYLGIDDGVSWHCHRGLAIVRRVEPQQGFVVVRLPPTAGKKKYGIGQIGAPLNTGVHRVPVDTGVWVFPLVPGQVTYVGSFRAVLLNGEPRIVGDDSITAADADDFMTRTFPNIRDHVVAGRVESAYMANDCEPRPLASPR